MISRFDYITESIEPPTRLAIVSRRCELKVARSWQIKVTPATWLRPCTPPGWYQTLTRIAGACSKMLSHVTTCRHSLIRSLWLAMQCVCPMAIQSWPMRQLPELRDNFLQTRLLALVRLRLQARRVISSACEDFELMAISLSC